ncbi:MAG TPA: helix-turn-helix domain-containing protein [Candidatus Thermoplasmatota archaeon]|nr:helix-turn-helix domain-containing protein [Candidatus Thermoplasmatota archaeon]
MTVNPSRVSRLMEHGLTEYEARAYLALLDLEKAEASPIADVARVPRTKIYQALEGLEGKRLIKVIPERPKRYLVQPLASYLDEIERGHKAKVEALQGEREALESEFAPKGKLQLEDAGGFIVLKGRANIASRLAEMIGQAERDVFVATSAAGLHRLAYHATVLVERAESGVRVRVAAPATEAEREAVEALSQAVELRAGAAAIGATTIAIADGKVLVAHHVPDDHHYFQGNDVALWSDDAAVVAAMMALLELAWNASDAASAKTLAALAAATGIALPERPAAAH